MGIKIAPADEGQEGYKNGAMIFWSLLTPFFGTALGAACVFFLKKGLGDRVQRGLTGFAAGVMVAASIWSLLIPAMEQSAGVGKMGIPAGGHRLLGWVSCFCWDWTI